MRGVASLKTDDGTILLINLDSKEWRDAYDAAVEQMKESAITNPRSHLTNKKEPSG